MTGVDDGVAVNDFGLTSTMIGAGAGERGRSHLGSSEDLVCRFGNTVGEVDVDGIGDHSSPEPGRQPAGDVAVVVGLAEEDQVGRIVRGSIGQDAGDREHRRGCHRGRCGGSRVTPNSPSLANAGSVRRPRRRWR